MTAIPLFIRSSQSRILFGFPVRTTKTIMEVKGVLFLGSRACHILGRRPALDAIASMTPESASVTTSASRPSMTDRACLPEPPCDWLIVTFWPVLAAQAFANAALISSYSSRVGSYETLRRVTDAGAARREDEEGEEISANRKRRARAAATPMAGPRRRRRCGP